MSLLSDLQTIAKSCGVPVETQEARLSLFTKGSYTKLKNSLVRALLGADFYITDRRYIGFETETGYHHYAIDVAQIYELEE